MSQIQVTLPSETTLIRVKDLMKLVGCSERTASKIFKEIKEEFNVKRVVYWHVKKYLFGT